MSPLVISGLMAQLGDFGYNAVLRALQAGTDFGDFFTSVRETFPTVDFHALRTEWKAIWRDLDWEPVFKALDPDGAIPFNMYRESSWELANRLAYRVHVYGRELRTGRYRSEDTFLSSGEPLTKHEAEDMIRSRIGAQGDSPKYDIFTIDVRGAFFRSVDQEEW